MGTFSRRALISHHEAGHAVVGHHQGLTFGVIYIGDAGGQVLFDAQWDAEAVVRDPDLLDRYGLMLLASFYVEQRCVGELVGAGWDIGILRRMVLAAAERGVEPRADLWRRAERQVRGSWEDIAALATELLESSTPVADPAGVLGAYPELGSSVDELAGARALAVIGRSTMRPVARAG
jgi:hypothetical protein